MSEIMQIIGIAIIIFWMGISLILVDKKQDFQLSVWLMVASLLVGMVIF